MKTFVCQICGYIAFDEAPVECPVCRLPIENFENIPDAIKIPADDDNLSELERKHIPHVSIGRECVSEHGEGCVDVHVRIGEIEHVMETEHFIRFIDFYASKKYLARVILTPQQIHPAVSLCLNVNTGKLTVVNNGNVHGSWIKKDKINEMIMRVITCRVKSSVYLRIITIRVSGTELKLSNRREPWVNDKGKERQRKTQK